MLAATQQQQQTPQGFTKDKKTGVVINNDQKALENFQHQRAKTVQMNNIVRDMEMMKKEISEIKAALTDIVNGRNNG